MRITINSEELDYMILHRSIWKASEVLSNENRLEFYKLLFRYLFNGEDLHSENCIVEAMLILSKDLIATTNGWEDME